MHTLKMLSRYLLSPYHWPCGDLVHSVCLSVLLQIPRLVIALVTLLTFETNSTARTPHKQHYTATASVNATGYSNAPMSLPLLLLFYHGSSHRHVLWNVNKIQTSPRHNSLCGCCGLLLCVSHVCAARIFSFGR